jgi:hypothetical protein
MCCWRARRAAELHYARALLRRHVHAWRTGAHASFRERMHGELESRWADGAQSEASKYAAVVARLEDELAAAQCAPCLHGTCCARQRMS